MNKLFWTVVKIIFIFLIPVVIIIRLFYIQVWQHRINLPKIETQISDKVLVNVPRGEILDRNNRILATSIELASVYIHSKSFIEAKEKLKDEVNKRNVQLICSTFKISEEELDEKCKKYKRFCLAKDVDLVDAFKVKYIPGVEVETYQKRVYPYENIGSYIVGRVNSRGKGYSGIEYSCENYLNRIKEKEIIMYSSGRIQRTPVRLADFSEIKEVIAETKNPTVVVTLDFELQQKLEMVVLAKFFDIFKPKFLVCIIQRIDTGEILVYSILPNTDAPVFDPVSNWVYEPGSVFKVFPLAIFLEEKVVTPNTMIYCENGEFDYLGVKINDVKPHKYLSVEDVLVHSSNIGMAKMYLMFNNNQKFYEYLTLFGFGSPTGIDLPAEAYGSVPDITKKAAIIKALNISFGQGISTTLLQIVNGYTAIANNGQLLQPYIVKCVLDSNNNVIFTGKKRVIRKIMSDTTAKLIKQILYQTVERGTAVNAKINGIKICAKTGTAQKFDTETGRYSQTKYLMSCCGFFPMEEPKFTIGIFVDEPQIGRLASSVAVPIFREVVLELLNYYNNGVYYAKAN